MMKTAVAVAVLAFALSGCTAQEPVTVTQTVMVTTEAVPPISNLPTLSQLYDACKFDGLMNVTLNSDGDVLSFELPEHSIATLTVTATEAACVAVGLEIPDVVVAKIDATDAGDPPTTESWENVNLTWKISDNGTLTFIYEMDA